MLSKSVLGKVSVQSNRLPSITDIQSTGEAVGSISTGHMKTAE